ncbi:hypothetical protein CupriaWKF_27995 [Cupriavidus sp. WKF15]|uniref:hypothetical protein n=1 Tax=Cupriavidus sp. WKF15 TaxID=3032282 RepID=UPI0023E0F4DA|nr:hypothetical protein [Cupriavidus sp. WKF15]WER48616.1 hypothetical protein CupriaWKF_27995 [Cupriavidus sp. WKF15]
MHLANHQRKLLGLIRSSYQVGPDDEAYFHVVAQSRDLIEARTNIVLWRAYVLQRACVLTYRLLERRGIIGDVLGKFCMEYNISPFRETQGPAFLEMLSNHDDLIVASVARFELALLRVRQGDPNIYIIKWNIDPLGILNSLAKDVPYDGALVDQGCYEAIVSKTLPNLFNVAKVEEH